ncbi:hypothetical protein KQH82_04860 [bacterium]|nr:hypothetical protein [bacterium]
MHRAIPCVVSLILCLAAVSVSAQSQTDLKALLSPPRPDSCRDYIRNAHQLIPPWYDQGKLDSVRLVIEFVEQECETSSFDRLKTLLAIESGEFETDLCDSALIDHVLHGYYHRSGRSPDWLTLLIWGERIPLSDTTAYSRLVDSLTARLIRETDSTSAAYVVLMDFTGDYDYIRKRLHRGAYPGTCLQEAYNREIAYWLERRYRGRIHLAALTGIWMPQHAASVLGNKAELGFKIGWRGERLGTEGTVIFRFLDAKREYVVRQDGKEDRGRSFFGGYVGADLAYEAIRSETYALALIGGIGLDGFGHGSSKDDDDNTSGVNSLNLNIGAEYRLACNRTRTRYVGVQGRYNVVNYATGGRTDLSGNAVSLELIYGGLGNTASSRLDRLKYYD